MRTPVRLCPLLVGLLVWSILPVGRPPVHGQSTAPTAPRSDSTTASSLVDSLEQARRRFEAGRLPSRADSTHLRRWADSLEEAGTDRWREEPGPARASLRRALRAYRQLGDSANVADVLGDVGITYYYQSRYAEAIDRLDRALAIRRALPDSAGIAGTLGNTGLVHWQQGQLRKALAQYRASLRIKREIGDEVGIARTLNNMGIIHKEQGRYDRALANYRESLSIARALGAQRGVALNLNNIGSVYATQGRYEAAISTYRASLRIKRKIGDRRGVSESIGNVGSVREKQGRYEAALANYRTSLRIDREIGNRKGVAGDLSNIGAIHLRAGRLRAAADTLDRAVRLAEQLRLDATSPEARRSMLSTQIGAYRALTTTHVRRGAFDAALQSAEKARARLLTDRLAGTARGDTTFTVPEAPSLQRTLGPREGALVYANAGTKWPLTVLAVTADRIVARELPDSTVRARVKQAYSSQLRRLRRENGPLGAALETGGLAPADEAPSLAAIVRLYRSHLVGEADDTIETDLARRLRRLLVAPVAAFLRQADRLTVVPNGALGVLPFETLRDAAGQYLVERVHVRYAPSLTVLRQLQARPAPPAKRPLLALGGADYASPSPSPPDLLAEARRGSTRIATESAASALLRAAERQGEQGRSPRSIYERMGYGSWPSLPATESEVRLLGRTVGTGATVLTGDAVSETMIRALSRSGRLRQYRRVHFATHGAAVPEAPGLSALVLSQAGASDSLAARDGFLTMDEIARLRMRADVAVLSACQTGLGKVVAGEGVVSLSHAFLRAGADATLVSHWKVLDRSTQQFMAAVYRRSRKTDTSFLEAVTEAKRAFIAGHHGPKSTDPLRWAPFVYYGRE